MRFLRIGLLCAVLFSGCAGLKQESLPDCSPELALARGAKDGSMAHDGEADFLRMCSPESRELAHSSYRQAFESSRAKRHHARAKPESEEESFPSAETEQAAVPGFTPDRQPATEQWICEVEANSKIFTGVGVSRDEALGSARASCGSHLQATYCNKADCKKNL